MPDREVLGRTSFHYSDDDGKEIVVKSEDDDGKVPKWLMPIITALAVALATGAFTFAWGVSKDMAVMKAQQAVNPVEFAAVKTELAQTQRDIERLRTWMTNHVNRAHEEPAPAPQ